MITITFGGNKGGTGKTSSCQNLGVKLGSLGYKVLMVDCDSQGNLSESLGVEIEDLERTLYDVLKNKDIKKGLIKGIRENIDIIPSNVTTDYSNIEFQTSIPRLKSVLKKVKNEYDFCLIDTSTYLTALTRMGVLASDYVICSVSEGSFSIKGAYMMKNLIEDLNEDYKEKIKILGIVMNMYSVTKLSKATFESIEEIFGAGTIFESKIRRNVKINESQGIGLAVVEKFKRSNGNKDYINFTEELLNKLGLISL